MDFYTPEQDRRDSGAQDAADASLPLVFIIGDSISQGYTPPVRALLRGVCRVERPRANCGDTRAGLAFLDDWLAVRQPDLIHFNWGLHDLCYRHPEATVYGNRDKVRGTISVPPDAYRTNLEQLVDRLQARCSRLVWASTTFVPPGEAGRFQGDDVRYNAIAAGIMNRRGIAINDLHALTAAFDPGMFSNPGDVHFTEEGTRVIARQVAACIRDRLAASGGAA